MISPKVMVQGTDAPNAVAAQHTCATNTQEVITHAVFTNHTGGAVTLTAHIVPSGGSATAANKVLDVYSIAANTAYTSPELAGVVLNPGDALHTVASTATAIAQSVSGIVYTP